MPFSSQIVVEFAGAAIAALALAVSALGLFLSRRDKRVRLEISVRYEYRARASGGSVRARGASQEELLASLADFLRAHDLGYADGEAVVSFVLKNRGNTAVYPRTARLLLLSEKGGSVAGVFSRFRGREPLVVDPASGCVRASEFPGGAEDVAARTGPDRRLPDHISPGRSFGLWCGLSPLARVLISEGYPGEVEMALQIRDQLGNSFIAPFPLDTDIWHTARAANRSRT
jgi:hypothetical protein